MTGHTRAQVRSATALFANTQHGGGEEQLNNYFPHADKRAVCRTFFRSLDSCVCFIDYSRIYKYAEKQSNWLHKK
jgi:hypothetical protein